jgi:hypothetical protein
MAKSKNAPLPVQETMEQKLARLEAENAALRGAAMAGRVQLAPGVYEGATLPAHHALNPDYDKAKRLRVLPNGSEIVWTVGKSTGWLSMVADFRPRKGVGISPGLGGYMNRHLAYAQFFKGADYNADLAWGKANGAADAPAAK